MARLLLLTVSLILMLAPMALAKQAADIAAAPACHHCGMDREKFNQSRMVVAYDDGSSVGVCSLHCAAVELATTIDRGTATLLVADYDSKELVDAEKAVWVVGGSKKGVMTAIPKWAFAGRGAAERFTRTNGGTITTFEEAIKAAYDDMYQDTKMIREFRKMK
jgi:nitrous oxide reductase accessory protein NosL